jgi:hypothetical protein
MAVQAKTGRFQRAGRECESAKCLGRKLLAETMCVSLVFTSHVGKTITNHPFGNGLYHLFIVICGMVTTLIRMFIICYLLQCICFNESMNLIMGLCFHYLIVSFFDFPVYGLSIEKQKEFSVFAPIPNISCGHVSKIGTPCQYT